MIKICKRCKKERDTKDFYLSHGYIQNICKWCSKETNRKWREKNYNKVLEVNKIWKRENTPRKTKKRWGVYTFTKEDQRKSWRKYAKTDKGVYASLKSSCEYKKNSRLKISKEDFIDWYSKEEKKCRYCSITEIEWKNGISKRHRWYKRLTIERIDNSKGYELGNLALSCQLCNSIKSDFFEDSEMIIIGRVIKDKLKTNI